MLFRSILECYEPTRLLNEVQSRLIARPFLKRRFPDIDAPYSFQLFSFTNTDRSSSFSMQYGIPKKLKDKQAFQILNSLTVFFKDTLAAAQTKAWMMHNQPYDLDPA